VGSVIKQFEPGSIDSAYHCQVFCFREKKDHPQVLATSRHISCGGVDLQQVEWKANVLEGSSRIVAKDDYSIYIYEPAQTVFDSVTIDDGNAVIKNEKAGFVRTLVIHSAVGSLINWKVFYKQPIN
jgi:hypothetical protein